MEDLCVNADAGSLLASISSMAQRNWVLSCRPVSSLVRSVSDARIAYLAIPCNHLARLEKALAQGQLHLPDKANVLDSEATFLRGLLLSLAC